MQSLVWWQIAQCVATDVTEHTAVVILLQHVVQSLEHEAVATTLAECWWTWNHELASRVHLLVFQSEGSDDIVWSKLSCAWHLSSESSLDGDVLIQDTAQHLLNNWLSVFEDEQ